MGPKKQAKKQVVEEPPKQQQPQIPQHQLRGYGKFQYLNGTVYEGNWHLFNGIKMKHGEGVLKIPGTTSNNLGAQSYEGSWHEDKMQGHGVYKYACGASYKGQWKNNKHHGKGIYQFANGTIYEGDWLNHQMNGTGFYIDTNGRKWQGQYRKGKFQTKKQKQLLHQKQIQIRKNQAKKIVQSTITSMLQAIAKSDKKTLKQNLTPYFSSGQIIKQLLKQPYSKFDERPPQKWTQTLNILKFGNYKVLTSAKDAKFLAQDKILSKQQQGRGQIVQVLHQKQQRNIRGAFINVEGNVWVLASFQDQQKKK